MTMNRVLLIAGLTATAVDAFAPFGQTTTRISTSSIAAADGGGFYDNLNTNTIPPHNNWFPKHDKSLKGDFYGELNTQKELKVSKATTAPAAAPAKAAAPPAVAPKPPAQTPQQAPATAAAAAFKDNLNTNTVPAYNNWFPKHDTSIKGDFYGDLNRNTIPPHNNWFPKHDKSLIGDFYGELKTQKELKIPKAKAAALPKPEDTMTKAMPATPVPQAVPAAAQQQGAGAARVGA